MKDNTILRIILGMSNIYLDKQQLMKYSMKRLEINCLDHAKLKLNQDHCFCVQYNGTVDTKQNEAHCCIICYLYQLFGSRNRVVSYVGHDHRSYRQHVDLTQYETYCWFIPVLSAV